jgi:hypothetical protein
VYVIFNAADLQCGHAMSARDTADKCPDTLFYVRHQPRLAILG